MPSLRKSPFLLLTVLFLPTLLQAQEEGPALEFVKGPACPIVDNFYEKEIVSISLLEREIEATFVSFGKAHPLSDEVLARLKAKDRSVYRQATKIRTALKLRQDDREFYLRGLDSIAFSKLQPGHRLRGRVLLVAIRTKAGVCYIPLIRDIKGR